MTTIAINFKNLAIGLAAIGLTLGAAFGAGIAYGRTEDSGTSTATTPSIEDLIAARGGSTGAAGSGNFGGGGGFQSPLGSQGTVTAIDGDTITIETAQGSVQLHTTDSTSISLLRPVSLEDLTVGSVVIADGEERDDGSVDATVIEEVPAQFQTVLGGGSGPAGGGSNTPGGTPDRSVPAETPTLETAPSGTPPASNETPQTEGAGAQPLPDRTSCDDIRGTEYRSPTEREFFLANCVASP